MNYVRVTQRMFALFFMMLVGITFQHRLLAQAKEITEGKEFFFGIPHCDIEAGEGARGTPVQLWLSSKVTTRATVMVPRTGEILGVYTLSPNKVRIIMVPELLMNRTTGITDNGIYIKANDPITATVYISYVWSGEAYRVIPLEVLGKRYFTLNMYQDRTERERPGQILITATKDNTAVTVYPKTATEDGVAAGGNKTYNLNRGQTLLIKAKIQPSGTQDWSTDLSGTKIEASKPISVISGHTKGAFPRYTFTMLGRPANFMRNMMVDAMWPAEFLGKEYFSAPVKYNNRPRIDADADSWGDLIRVVATEDNTIISTQTAADNGVWKQRSNSLKAGQYWDVTNQEVPCLYRANKPILIGQYGKAWRNQVVAPIINPDGSQDGATTKGNTTQNPSRNGQGMMYVLTPKEQWSSFTTFHTPEGIDNFVMITFYTNDVDKMKFDNVAFRARFGSYIKAVPNTDMSYVVAEIPAGDHTVEGAKFTAYVYGNWDRSKDGFAYGYPTGVNFVQACPDTITLDGPIDCGVVDGLAKILPDTSTCGAIFSVSMVDSASTNYTFELDPSFESGAKRAKFTLRPIDITKDAKATIVALTRSGKEAVKTFEYIAEKITVKPTKIDFGSLAVGEEDCSKTITVKNVATIPTTVRNVKLKAGKVEFTIKPGQLPRILQPNEEMVIEVCAKTVEPTKATIIDSVLSELSCFNKGLAELRIQSGVPCVRIEDVAFGTLPINIESQPKVCTITNTSKFDVSIFKITYPDQSQPYPTVRKFREDLSAKLPVTIKAGGIYEFNVWYTPTEAGKADKLSATLETNADLGCSDVVSDWTGDGSDAGPLLKGYDFKIVRVLDDYNVKVNNVSKYDGTIVVDAFSPSGSAMQDPQISKVEVVSLPNGVAKWEDAFQINLSQMPKQLFPKDPRSLDVTFTPTVVGDYKIKVTLSATIDGKVKEVSDFVEGIAVVPVEVAEGYSFCQDFKDIPLSTSKNGIIKVKSSGTMDLTIKGLKVTNDANNAFQIDPTWYASKFANGATIVLPKGINGEVQEPQGVLEVPVIFTARIVGKQTARIDVDCDLYPNQIIHADVDGCGQNPGIDKKGYDFGEVYKCNPKTSTNDIYVQNVGGVDLKVVSITPAGTTDQYFTVTNMSSLIGSTIKASTGIAYLEVDFVPGNDLTKRRQKIRYDGPSFGFDWVLSDDNGGQYTAFTEVAGTGIDLITKVSIPRDYRVNLAQMENKDAITLDFNLGDSPNRIDDGKVTNFHAYINYNKDAFLPIEGVENIITNGTLCNGWEVRKATIKQEGEFEVELATPSGNPMTLQGVGTLFRFKMNAFYSSAKETELPCSMDVTTSSCWVNVDSDPGYISVEQGCVSYLRHVTISATTFALQAVKPNPVSNSANISYQVGYDAFTNISVYNAMGELVLTAINQPMKSGAYDMTVDLSSLPSGSYFYRMTSGHWTSDAQPIIIQK